MLRVSDHYSACFVTKAERVACWGLESGGTWNGIAERDRDPELEGVVDIAIVQTKACAILRDGTSACWAGGSAPKREGYTKPVREIALSTSGARCTLFDDGSVSWRGASLEREVLPASEHLVACDVHAVCAERAGAVVCEKDWDAPDVRSQAVRKMQLVALEALTSLPNVTLAAADDSATAFCAVTNRELVCATGRSGGVAPVPDLKDPSEIAVGYSSLHPGNTACARAADGKVSCWMIGAVPLVARVVDG
jgi:hypothetical protein